MKKPDREGFRQFLRQCTDAQVRGASARLSV